jgi:hypothetical protein
MWLNANLRAEILSGILAHYRFPEKTFVGSPETVQVLKLALIRAGRMPRAARSESKDSGSAR